jgi:hypothetical protein
MEASGMAVKRKVINAEIEEEPTGKKKPKQKRQKGLTFTLAVRLRKLPVLPQKLLEEMLPGVGGALLKETMLRKRGRFLHVNS